MTHRFMFPTIAAKMPWPAPALMAWAASWCVFIVATRWFAMSSTVALLLAAAVGISASLRGDIWTADWSGYDMVYLFQRPESMARAATKAERELRQGAWMASLEFKVPDLVPTSVLDCPDGRSLWLYQVPFKRG